MGSNSNNSCSSSSLYPKEVKSCKSSSSSSCSTLHAVHRLSSKPMKMPIAPQPRIPPKIYKVEPRDFKELVQKLTSAPKNHLNRRLQEAAPPPLDLSLPRPPPPPQPQPQLLDTNNENPRKLSDSFGAVGSPLGLALSPSSQEWLPSLVLISPGTLCFLEQTTVT